MKLDISSRWSVIKTVLASKYLGLFLTIFILYIAINFFINQFYETLPVFFSFRLSFVIPYVILSLLIGLLVSINITLIVYKLRQVRTLNTEQTGATAMGVFGGMLGGACPGCFVGLLPSLAGVFGVTVSLSSLPFLGYEIQIPTLLILGATTYVVASPLTCKVEIKK